MRVLKSWILDYLNSEISDTDLIDKIIFSGTEVEGVFGEIDPKIIVVEIKQIEKHPNADRLHKLIVNDGESDIQIVCGADNIEVGQRVPLAQPGARIGDSEISEATIRGVASSGMLCSEKELGVGEDHSGIKTLPSDTPLGYKLSQILGSDIILDIKPTPNRGDCFCHLGIARDVAATLSDKISIKVPKIDKFNPGLRPKVQIDDKELCSRYGARILKGIKVGPSKPEIANRLIACGMKPINNIVDITNYIMLDLGQPMHAFDASKIKDHEIIVRPAKDNEQILCLDDKLRTLSSDNLVIADFEKPIAVAGVIGGKDSEITETTTDIILEAAEFGSKSIRKTSKNLEIVTEASYRFERGIDSSGIERAIDKATQMIIENCGVSEIGESEIVSEKLTRQEIDLNINEINEILGSDFKDEEIQLILTNLGFEIDGNKCSVPYFRHDIVDYRCLAEEVGRIYGYNKLPDIELEKLSELPTRGDFYKKEYIKDLLCSTGFTEVYNYSFMSDRDIKECGVSDESLLEVINPVQPENKYLRNSLIPGILKTIAKNPTFDPVLIFEMGNVFDQKHEKTVLCAAAAGKNAKKFIDDAVSKISNKIGIDTGLLKNTEISRSEIEKFKIKKPVTYLFEIEIEKIIQNMIIDNDELDLVVYNQDVHYRSISKYPSVTRDLAFILDKDKKSLEIIDMIYKVSELINRVELFDEFESDKFGKDKKNIAFHLYLQSMDRTLNDQEAETVIKEVIDKIENNFNATLRS